MKAVIFLGGAAAKVEVPEADMIVAADRGWDNALANGVIPDLLVGDMDSISGVPDEVEIIRVPCEKDETDTQLAVRIAIERGADEIVMIGQLSGRGDHTLSAIFTVESLMLRGIKAELRDDRNRVRAVKDGSVTVRRGYKYFGVLSLGRSVVSEVGCRYPLMERELVRSDPFAVSNEVTGDEAAVTASGDTVLVIESN